MPNDTDKEKLIKSLLENMPDPNSNGSNPSRSESDIIDLGDNFDFDGFQVVRREFFAHLHEPSVTFNNYRFSVNSACLQRFPETTSVQVLVNQETKILALMPCPDDAKDSFIWCKTSKGKRCPRPVTCKLFFAKIVDMMDWNPDYRYKLLGKVIRASGETILAFDLTATEVYQRIFTEGAKPKTSRTPIFPASWQNQFGLPYNEHRQSMQVNIFDGYAIYSVTESQKSSEEDPQNAVQA